VRSARSWRRSSRWPREPSRTPATRQEHAPIENFIEDVMEIGRHWCHAATRVDPTRFSALTRAVFHDDYQRNVFFVRVRDAVPIDSQSHHPLKIGRRPNETDNFE
jgi:hypothetical protein